MGVTASPLGPPGRTGLPASSSSTAGGGIGIGPWAERARPRPSSGGAREDPRPAEQLERHRRAADVHD